MANRTNSNELNILNVDAGKIRKWDSHAPRRSTHRREDAVSSGFESSDQP